jgi:FAD/FMN-containing dehydrogenase
VVLPDGQIIRTGSPHVSDPAFGYDLTRLFSNAEGTLGIITEVTFRMYRLPEHQIITMYKFPNFTETINAVIAIRDSGLVPETLETMDGMSYCIYAKEARAKETSENIGAMVIGNAGAEKLIRSQVELTQEICDRYKGTVTPDTCVERWKAFRETYPVNPFPLQSAAKKKPIKYVLDAVVPLASTAELVSVYHGLVEKYGVESREFSARHCAPDFQSVVYARAYVDERDKKNCAAVRKMEAELYCTIRKLGGGIGGAGGIGLTRLPYANNGEAPASDLGKKLKRLLDANNIMNPGKKFTF